VDARIRTLKWALGTALLSTLVLCPRLWVTDRAFPTVPAFAGLPDLPQWISLGLTGLFAVSAVVVSLLPRPGLLMLAPPALAALLVCFDINRLQPWLYQYLLMFVALSVVDWNDPESRRTKAGLAACAAIVIGTYVWSGVQKANLSFAVHTFPWLIEPLGPDWVARLRHVWFVAPVFEASVGVLLFFPRTRVPGLAAAALMHVFVLLALGPFGQHANPVVWPWNLWMPIIAVIVFYGSDRSLLSPVWNTALTRALVALVGVMPALSFVGPWDAPLSASLYSGTLRDGWIYLTGDGARRLPAMYTTGNPGFAEDAPGRYRLDITRWAQAALNVPPYAEPRVYRGIVKRLEQAGVPRDQMTLLVRDWVSVASSARTYSAMR
jgi:hypothetical protein